MGILQKMKGWAKGQTPEDKLMLVVASLMIDDPKGLREALLTVQSTVNAPVEWDQAEQTWVVRTSGLAVGGVVSLATGRGGAEMEKAVVAAYLGSGRYALSFNLGE